MDSHLSAVIRPDNLSIYIFYRGRQVTPLRSFGCLSFLSGHRTSVRQPPEESVDDHGNTITSCRSIRLFSLTKYIYSEGGPWVDMDVSDETKLDAEGRVRQCCANREDPTKLLTSIAKAFFSGSSVKAELWFEAVSKKIMKDDPMGEDKN